MHTHHVVAMTLGFAVESKLLVELAETTVATALAGKSVLVVPLDFAILHHGFIKFLELSLHLTTEPCFRLLLPIGGSLLCLLIIGTLLTLLLLIPSVSMSDAPGVDTILIVTLGFAVLLVLFFFFFIHGFICLAVAKLIPGPSVLQRLSILADLVRVRLA